MVSSGSEQPLGLSPRPTVGLVGTALSELGPLPATPTHHRPRNVSQSSWFSSWPSLELPLLSLPDFPLPSGWLKLCSILVLAFGLALRWMLRPSASWMACISRQQVSQWLSPWFSWQQLSQGLSSWLSPRPKSRRKGPSKRQLRQLQCRLKLQSKLQPAKRGWPHWERLRTTASQGWTRVVALPGHYFTAPYQRISGDLALIGIYSTLLVFGLWSVVDFLLTVFRPVSAQSIVTVSSSSTTGNGLVSMSLQSGQGVYYYSMVDGTTQWIGAQSPPATYTSLVHQTVFVTVTPSPVQPYPAEQPSATPNASSLSSPVLCTGPGSSSIGSSERGVPANVSTVSSAIGPSTTSASASLSATPSLFGSGATLSAQAASTVASSTSAAMLPDPDSWITRPSNAQSSVAVSETGGWNGTAFSSACLTSSGTGLPGTGACGGGPTSRNGSVEVISFGGTALSFTLASQTANFSTDASYWSGTYPTATDSEATSSVPSTAMATATFNDAVSVPNYVLFAPTTSGFMTVATPTAAVAARAATSAVAAAKSGGCGEHGNFTVDFDNTARLKALGKSFNAPPVVNPYRHLFFANGFGYVPEMVSPFAAQSPPNVAMYFPVASVLSSLPVVGSVFAGEVGAGSRASVDAFWFDAHYGYFGCLSVIAGSCTMQITGHRYDNGTGREVQAAQQNATLPGCAGLVGCMLTQVAFSNDFRGLSGIQFQAFVNGRGNQAFAMDSLRLSWWDNSCWAGIVRFSDNDGPP